MSKKEALKNIVIGLIFVALGSLMVSKHSVIGYVVIVFFGCCTILLIIKFFNPKFKWVKSNNINSPEFKEQTKREFLEKFDDNGIFTFGKTGFTVKITSGKKTVKWSEVVTIVGYKIDKLSYDNICMDIFCDNKISFSINEETPGWFKFLKNSKAALSITDKNWEIEISTPAFKTNLTVVYDRENRSLEELEKLYYQTKT